MKDISERIVALLLSSAFIAAPSFGQSPMVNGVPLGTTCPLAMQAQFVNDSHSARLQPVDPNQVQGIGQELHLDLKNLKSVEIVGVQVKIHGFTTEGRIAPVQISASEITKTLDLVLKVGSNQDASTDVWLDGFGAVTSVALNSVRYADGSTWRSSVGQSCHAMFGMDRVVTPGSTERYDQPPIRKKWS